MANITFLSFLLFSMCHYIHVAVNTWLNCSFFTLITFNCHTTLRFFPDNSRWALPTEVKKGKKERRPTGIAVNGYSISQLLDVTCHMGSHVQCYRPPDTSERAPP